MYTISIFDKNGNLIDIPVDEFLRIKINQTISEDKALGIKRSKIPFHFFLLPDKPQTEDFCKLAQEIEKIATFNLAPDNSSQGIWMRCIQLYWQAKAILLANKIFKLISDPSIDGGYLTQILPHKALQNLQIETDADKALYDLLKVGESEIIFWANTKNISYPFANFQELFIYILKARFERNLQEEAFSLLPLCPDKKLQKKHYSQWLKFLSFDFEEGKRDEEYKKVLMDMGWEGYYFLALRLKRNDKQFKKLWRFYINTHKAMVKLIDSRLYWKNSIPHQTKCTNKRLPIQGIVTNDGFFDWVWENERVH